MWQCHVKWSKTYCQHKTVRNYPWWVYENLTRQCHMRFNNLMWYIEGLLWNGCNLNWYCFTKVNHLAIKSFISIKSLFLVNNEKFRCHCLFWVMALKFALFTKGSKLPLNQGFQNRFLVIHAKPFDKKYVCFVIQWFLPFFLTIEI